MNRRRFLSKSGAAAVASFGGLNLLTHALAETKESFAAPLDSAIEAFMLARNIPGAAVAVAKDQRLLYVRGFGWADREKRVATPANGLFRIASITKPITAVAILKLVEAGRLDLQQPVFDFIKLDPIVVKGKKSDDRLKRISIRHCLHHTGGWDRDKSGDPMFRSRAIARAAGTRPPAMQEAIIRYMLGQPLDFAPGARYAYSNFGFCLLGRVIEKVTGVDYATFVQREILGPGGIKRPRLGASLASRRARGEVKYYAPGQTGRCVFPDVDGEVPEPYGAFCLEAMDSHGSWIASAADLVRFATVLNSGGLLNPESRSLLFEPPVSPVGRKPDGDIADHFYGCGWDVRRIRSEKVNSWHLGSLPGSFTLLVHRWDGFCWAALFNQRSQNSALPDTAIDPVLHRAIDAVKQWPDHDLFSTAL